MVEFTFTGRDTKLIDNLITRMNAMSLPQVSESPVCIKDYASAENTLARENPRFAEARYNPVPVRIIIDKEGNVKHIHFLSAFPEQAQSITTAMAQWHFKPYLVNGHPAEVETGIMFGRRDRSVPAQGDLTSAALKEPAASHAGH